MERETAVFCHICTALLSTIFAGSCQLTGSNYRNSPELPSAAAGHNLIKLTRTHQTFIRGTTNSFCRLVCLCLCLCLSPSLSLYISFYLSIHISIFLSIYLSSCLSIFLSLSCTHSLVISLSSLFIKKNIFYGQVCISFVRSYLKTHNLPLPVRLPTLQ